MCVSVPQELAPDRKLAGPQYPPHMCTEYTTLEILVSTHTQNELDTGPAYIPFRQICDDPAMLTARC